MGVRGSWPGSFTCIRCERHEFGPESWCGEESPEGWKDQKVYLAHGSDGELGLDWYEELPLCPPCQPVAEAALKKAEETYIAAMKEGL